MKVSLHPSEAHTKYAILYVPPHAKVIPSYFYSGAYSNSVWHRFSASWNPSHDPSVRHSPSLVRQKGIRNTKNGEKGEDRSTRGE